MAWQQSLQAAIRALRREEKNVLKDLESVRARIGELQSLSKGGAARGRKGRAQARGSKRLSAHGRAAISRAAKKRWAEYRAQKRRETS